MKIRYSMLKSLISSACLISVGGQSLSHAMDYNEILESTKDNFYLQSIPEETIEYMKKKGYTIEKFLGSGHSGLVFLATYSKKNKCVLKFTSTNLGLSICPNHYNVCNINELPEAYRSFFKNSYTSFTSPTGDCLLYENLNQNGIVDLGKNACKIYGLERIGKVNGYYKICVILEYIDGTNLCDYIKTTKYNTSQVKSWIKDICNSLKIMYKKNFLHISIGISNVRIRKCDKSAVLIDYERSNYKDLIETLRNIRQNKYDKASDELTDELTDEYGKTFVVRESCENGQYYDLAHLRILINDLLGGNKYENINSTLHNNILELKEANTLEEFLKKVDEL